MNNRFSLKDLVLFTIVIVAVLSVWLSMWQEDRRFADTSKLGDRLSDLERQQGKIQRTLDDARLNEIADQTSNVDRRLKKIEAKLESGVAVQSSETASASTSTTPASAVEVAKGTPGGRDAQGRDVSWARPGTDIAWQPNLAFDSDPLKQPGAATGGSFTEAINAQPSTVVPLVYKDVYGAWVFERITEYLAEWNPKTLELRGVLANAWQFPKDGTWLRVRINDRARFSDGEPVTADDVIWTFNWMRNPLVQAERGRSVTDFIESITKVDDKTVEFKFNLVLFTNLSGAMGSFPVLPKHIYENVTPTQFNEATGFVIGSGPFKFSSTSITNQWTPSTDVVLVRNEQYWGPKPVYDELRFKVISEDTARLIAFNNGEADLTTPSPVQYGKLKKDAEWAKKNTAHLWFNIRGGYNFIGWNCDLRNGKKTIFADKRVRRAMTMLLDRDLMNAEFFENTGRISNGPFNRETAQANPSILPLPYDVNAAITLLEEAGWKVRPGQQFRTNDAGEAMEFEFTFAVGSEVTRRVGDYLKDQCARVGIRVKIRTMDWSVFMKTMDDRDYDALTMGWSPASPESDPQQIWHSRYIENQGDNFVQWRNADADKLIEEGRLELDPAKRMEIWHKLHQILHDEQPYTFLLERPWIRIVRGRVGNFVEYKNGFQYDEIFLKSGAASTPTQ